MTEIQSPTVGVAVITYKAVPLLPTCLPHLLASPLRPTVLVVNSSSNDGTVELRGKWARKRSSCRATNSITAPRANSPGARSEPTSS